PQHRARHRASARRLDRAEKFADGRTRSGADAAASSVSLHSSRLSRDSRHCCRRVRVVRRIGRRRRTVLIEQRLAAAEEAATVSAVTVLRLLREERAQLILRDAAVAVRIDLREQLLRIRLVRSLRLAALLGLVALRAHELRAQLLEQLL